MRKRDEPEGAYAKKASDALIREAKERNMCLAMLGVIDRVILVYDEESGLAVGAYTTTLKKDWD